MKVKCMICGGPVIVEKGQHKITCECGTEMYFKDINDMQKYRAPRKKVKK